MESINSLKNKYMELKNAAEVKMMGKNYPAAMKLIEQATAILKQIYDMDHNPTNREAYKVAMESLRKSYELAKNGGEEVLTYDQPKKPKPVKKPAQPSAKPEQGGAGEPDEDGIIYEWNGIDVKRFLATEARKKVLFDDVVGMEQQKTIIRNEFFLTDEQRAYKQSIGLENKNFILLYGLPGTGKTYFAMAVSNELAKFSGGDVPFFCVSCGQIKEAAVGKSENNLIAIFQFTTQFERCVLFMDEFDAIATDRGKNSGDPTAIPVVNTLLTNLDGFASNPNLLFLAATNYPYVLDAAIVSRVNESLEVPLPTEELLKMTLERKLKGAIDPSVDLGSIAATLARRRFSNRDLDRFVKSVKSQLFDAHLKNPDITVADNVMVQECLGRASSAITTKDVNALEEYKRSLM